MVSVNGKRTEGSIKELTDLSSQDPLGIEQTSFVLAYRRGSPSRIEGLGSSINGVWGRVPQWVWAKPNVLLFAMLCMARHQPKSLAEP